MEDLLETLPEKILKRITGEANSDSDTDVDDGNSEEENSDEESEQEEEEEEEDEKRLEYNKKYWLFTVHVKNIEYQYQRVKQMLFSLSDEEDETNSVKSLNKEAKLDEDDGGEFVVEEEEKDDEETIAAEEKLHEGDDYQSELDDLQKEGFHFVIFIFNSYSGPSFSFLF